MKTRTRIYLPTAVMTLMAAIAIPAPAQQPVPFEGEFQGYDTVNPPTITSTAKGNSSHMGRMSLTNILTFGQTLTGTGHWVAANGDTIETTFVVTSAVPGPVFLRVREVHTITGGTGRFAGAQGAFTVDRTHTLEPSDDGTHVIAGTFEGAITPPGANH